MLFARGVDWPALSHGTSLIKGVSSDILLNYGLFVLLRALALALPATTVGRCNAKWVLLLASFPLLFSHVLRAADFAHCYMLRAHFAAESFLYLEGGFAGRFFTLRGGELLLITATVVTLHLWLVKQDIAQVTARIAGQPARDRRIAVVVALVAGVLAPWRPIADALRYPPHEFDLRVIPEMNFARQWLLYRADARERQNDVLPTPTAQQWTKWQAAGLVPREGRADAAFPLYRLGLGEPPLPFAKKTGARLKPDIVLTMLESTNRVFIHELSGHFRGLMPELGQLSRQMTVVDNYWNSTSPTIGGLVATACSVYPPTHPADLNGKDSVASSAAYTCLAEVLRNAGYRTVFLQGSDATGLATDKFLVAHGFDEVLSDGELHKRFPNALKSEMGYGDREVLAFAQEQIERLEKLEHADHKPFFLLVMTLDTHEPGLAPAECQLPRDATGQFAVEGVPTDLAGQRALAAFHCTDKLLGIFGRFILAPERANRLLWLVTADHATFHTLANDSVFKNVEVGWSFDRLPLLLHDPLHDLPPRVDVLSGSLDVAPTIMHLLDLDGAASNMAGKSIFGGRRKFPYLVGRIGSRLAWVNNGVEQRDLVMAELPQLCARKDPLTATGASPLDACDLQAYFAWQDGLWTHRRLAPWLKDTPTVPMK